MKDALIAACVFVCACSQAQDYNFDGQWEILGPLEKPIEDGRRSANGIGPIEFITANQQIEGLLLATALNGGLFYSTDGGEQWINAGSDNWPYSACAWAQFHPDNSKVWYAYSNAHGDNGSAGAIGIQGGIYRTLDSGLNWELIADKSSFINSEFLTVHGFKFHPKNTSWLYVYTTEGIYRSKDALSDEVKWERVGTIGGWVFDLEFTQDYMLFSQMQHDKWNVFICEDPNIKNPKKIDFINELKDPIETITCEVKGKEVYILINFLKKSDELWKYNIDTGKHDKILSNQRVIFGKGRTFELSPYSDEVILGYSTTLKRYDIQTKSENRMGSDYHVDIERVEYDPFDSSKIYIGTHGGVYISYDNGGSWVSKSKGLGVAEVEGLAVDLSNSERMAIGCFHDGSSLRDDFNGTGLYQWKIVNGGDGLIPLVPNNIPNKVYTSNQYVGGGLFISIDSGKTNSNIHNIHQVKTSGWAMAAVLHPEDQDLLFFNFEHKSGEKQGTFDLARTSTPLERGSIDTLTDFQATHGLEKYMVYGVYNSESLPDALFLHVISFEKNEEGEGIMVHKVFKNADATRSAANVRESWVELEIPRNDWIGYITADSKKKHHVYLAYVSSEYGTEGEYGDNGMIYRLKYWKKSNNLRREIDITDEIPSSAAGRYNLVSDGEGGYFLGTRTGVYYGSKGKMNGRGSWVKVGHGLPHCKVHGLHYDKKRRTLIIGFFGRGVWRYYL